MMDKENLDLLLVYSDDHATYGAAYTRWLAGFITHFEPTCILFARTGEPVMLCGPETPGYAKLHSKVQDIRVLRELTHPDEDYPYAKIEGLKQIVASFTGPASVKRQGIAGRSMIPYDLFAAFQAVLPGEWVSVDDKMCEMRAIKTEAEIAVIRYAYKIAEAGLSAALKTIAPGVPERHVAAEAEHAMRKMGVEGYGIDTMVASGENNRPILARTTMREIGKDNLVLLTFAPRYEGYHAAIGLPVLVGNPKDEAKRRGGRDLRAARLRRDAQSGPDLRRRSRGQAHYGQGRFGRNFLYSGIHSVGVIEFEPPIFGPSSKAMMQSGMVLSIDVPVFDGTWGGLRLEDGYLIEDSGAKRLTDFEYDVRK